MHEPDLSVDDEPRRAWVQRVLISVGLLAVVSLLPVWTPLLRLEHDLLSRLTAPVRPEAGVVVVGLDEPSLAALNETPPLPRRLHARLVDALADAGVATLGIDMLFAAPQTPEDDAALARALQGPMPVVLASADVAVPTSQVAGYRQTVAPMFEGSRHGSVAVNVDDDGVIRRAPAGPDGWWQTVARSAGRSFTPPPDGALLRFYAPEVPLPYIHYTQAMDPAGTLPPGALEGQVLLLGQNTPIEGVDQFVTPLSALGGGTQSGVFVHATALLNGLAGDWVVPAHPAGPALQALIAVAMVAWATRRWRGGRGVWLSAALMVLAFAGAVWSYVEGHWWSAVPTMAGLVLHVNVGAADSYRRERRRRERLRRDFARYVPPAVVEALSVAGAAPALHGERRELTLLFSDLAGFTAASEQLAPEAVARALNAYFSRMTQTVHAHGGTVDKFIGDAVMAFWNAPLADPDHASRAVACAQALQADMVVLREAWRGTPFEGLRLRTGVHTGDAAVGHFGSDQRFTYTAVGDAVNTAARLEGANKAFDTTTLVSGCTLRALPADSPARTRLLWLDTVVLAGRRADIDVYTPCDAPALVDVSLALRDHRRAGRWTSALECCDAWRALALPVGPQWLIHADRLRARLRAEAGLPAMAAPLPLSAGPRVSP